MAFIPAVKSKVWSERVRYSFPILHKGTCIYSLVQVELSIECMLLLLQHVLQRICVPLCSMG